MYSKRRLASETREEEAATPFLLLLVVVVSPPRRPAPRRPAASPRPGRPPPLRAVCRPWRAAERSSHPRPPLPWLVAPGHCVSLHDAAIHRVSLHAGATDVVCRGSFDNWLAMVPTSSPPPYQPFLLNPFTMATVKLPMWTNPETITKVVMSASPAGGGGGGITVAAIARADPRFVARLGKIFVCHLPARKKKEKKRHPDDDDDYAWSDISRVFYVQDIVFLEGKLYAVTEAEEIFAFDDADIEHYSRLPSDQWRWTHPDKQASAFGRTEFYLVACHAMGKVLVVSRDFGRACVPDTGGAGTAARYHTSRFKVYVVDEHDQLETWGSWRKKTRLTRIPRLRGHAIFIGDASCQAFDVTSSGGAARSPRIRFGTSTTRGTWWSPSPAVMVR
uniref:KIB1-4 beta-propeller domain-containing protein n=1 Tax=Oryza meridionalis TaxID=40149 RepID=A0A0E0DIP3_9ORYZ